MLTQELLTAYQTARHDLLALRGPEGQWTGELCGSPLATAVAANAMLAVARRTDEPPRGEAYRQVALRAVAWLAGCQNADGGWGDSQQGPSNLAATMAVEAVVHLAGAAEHHAERLGRAAQYVQAEGGALALKRRYPHDRPFAASILAAYAQAGLVPWRSVAALRFEVACLPRSVLAWLRGPLGELALPGLVAAGQDRFFHRGPRNPLTWLLRRLTVRTSATRIGRLQSSSGGFFDAIPLTAFVVQGLAAGGHTEQPIVRSGVRFLLDNVRGDGSWPIERPPAVWNTSRVIGALAAASGDVGALGCLDWLLAAERGQRDAAPSAPAGGWARSETPGRWPDSDTTAAALLALMVLLKSGGPSHRQRLEEPVGRSVEWLLAMQNADGGWPPLCRGAGRTPADRSAIDITARVLRTLDVWRNWFPQLAIAEAIRVGLDYLAKQQRGDGSWLPQGIVNPQSAGEANPLYGTAAVLLAYRDLGLLEGEPAHRGLSWLAAHAGFEEPAPAATTVPAAAAALGVEETALALEALLGARGAKPLQAPIQAGVQWLIAAVSAGRHREASPLFLSPANLCYDDKVNPLIHTVAALGQALREPELGVGI